MCWVREESAVGGGEFGASVNRCRIGVAVQHVGTIQDLESILLLGQEEPSSGVVYGNAKEMVEITQIAHGKFLGERRHEGSEERGGASCEDDIIAIQEQVGHGISSMKNEKRGVTLGGEEPESVEEAREAKKPSPGSLFETIQGLV